MKTSILVHNVKGGTGKTTVAIFLAEYFRTVKKLNTVVVDLDYQQANACQYFTSQDVLVNKPVTLSTIIDYILNNRNDLLDDKLDKSNRLKQLILDSFVEFENDQRKHKMFGCLASNLNLEETNNKLLFNAINIKYVFKILKNALFSLFDIIIVDTPPSVSSIVQSAYCGFDNLLIVSDIGEFGLTGINKSISLYESCKYDNSELKFLGIVLNKFVNNNYNKVFLAEIEPIFNEDLFDSVLYNYTDYQESLLNRKFLLRKDYSTKNEKSRINLNNFFKEVDMRLSLKGVAK